MSSEVESWKCRICLAETSLLNSIFSSDFISDISEKIERYSGIKISADDCLPHAICNLCIEELKVIDNFVEKCRQSDKKLREQVETKIKNEVEQTNEVDYWIDIKMEDEDDLPIIKLESHQTREVKLDRIIRKHHKRKGLIKSKRKKDKIVKLKRELNGPCVCNACGLQLKSRSAMEIHWRVHSGEKPYVCTQCLKRFAQKNTLRVHIERRHNTISINNSHTSAPDRRFFCETCGKAFKSRTSLKIHLRVHNDERPYKCSQCDRRFTQLGSLSVHERRHRGERPYSCDVCQKTFVEMTHLKRHYSVHSDERPYICSICGKGVKSPFALKQHLKLHSNSKEHVCDKCGMSFTIKGSLDSHVRVVHSEKSGQCLICNKICSNLDDHMTLHSGEKPHCCEVCNKCFSRKRGLMIHSKQHTQEGKYECNVPGCGRTFYAQWVLECHILKHTGNTPFVCKLCKKGFVRVCHLTKHMKINHPNDE